MIDRYARDALACYGRLRHLDPTAARAELERFDQQLLIAGPRAIHTDRPRDGRPRAASAIRQASARRRAIPA